MGFHVRGYVRVLFACACLLLLGIRVATEETQEFVFSFPHARSLIYEEAIHTPYVLVTSPSPCAVRVNISVPGISYTNYTYVWSTQHANFSLPTNAILGDTTGAYDKTVIVTSEGDIMVHGMCTERASSDGFSVAPASQLDDEYYIASFGPIVTDDPVEEHTTSYSEVSVSALGEETSITITNANGDQLASLTLKKYETYQLLSESDLTGAKITASNPVSVMAGNNCAWIPAVFDYSGTCAYIMEQLPGTESFGQQFVLAPFKGRESGYMYRVIAGMDSTTITINGGSSYTLNSQEFRQENVSSSDVITVQSDKPVLVAQYAKDWNTDMNGVGNPSMIIVSPTSDYKSNALVPVTFLSTARPQKTYINIIFRCSQKSHLELPNLSGFSEQTSFDDQFCIVSGDLAAGNVYEVSSQSTSAAFTVQVYGFARYAAYSYQVRGYDADDQDSDSCDDDGNGANGNADAAVRSVAVSFLVVLVHVWPIY